MAGPGRTAEVAVRAFFAVDVGDASVAAVGFGPDLLLDRRWRCSAAFAEEAEQEPGQGGDDDGASADADADSNFGAGREAWVAGGVA